MFSLQSLHTFGFAAKTKHLLRLNEANEQLCHVDGPIWLLGEGSNCVFTDTFDGTVVKVDIKGKKVIEHDTYYELLIGAGENWHQLVCFCLQQGIQGFENLALIPGTVGAAPIQNIGAYGVELNHFVDSVQVVEVSSGKTHWMSKEECQFGYRDSVFKRELHNKVMVCNVKFRLPKKWRPVLHYGELGLLNNPTAQDVFKKVCQIRQAKLPDPKILGNAGSFFKNPLVTNKHFAALQCEWPDLPCYEVDQNSVKLPAAWLIDRLGLKGKKIGGVQCHPHQALVLTHDGTGTSQQLLELARLIQQQVEQAFSIHLENEVRLIGKQGLIDL